MTHPTTRFAHRRLDAYRIALRLFEGVEMLARRFPRGQSDLKNQLRRSTAATVRHIAEGANRMHARDKAARFLLARAECGESHASLEMALIVGIRVPRELPILADRVAAMLTGLIRRERSRAD